MNIVIAIDSLKGSLTSLEAGKAIETGIKKVYSEAVTKVLPLADGGEGTVEALTLGMGGKLQSIEVTGPLGNKILAQYGILSDGKTAIVEMAAAAGITLVPDNKRNPLYTTTYGVGEILLDAMHKGCRHFIIGIGGSATNDGGVGMLQALGYDMLDADGNPVPFGAAGLKVLCRIDDSRVTPELKECSFRIACDVTNPLCGEKGCSAIYGLQKGASPEDIALMDKWMGDYARISKEKYSHADANAPGAGAAGGMGFAFLTFTNATLESGIEIVLAETKLEDHISKADLVITGEGRLDGQTVMGKAPVGAARIAKKYNKPVIAFAGCVTPEATACNEHGIDAFFPILRGVVSLSEAMEPKNARQNMIDTVEQAMRLLKVKI
ncbi:glycerate kinase [Anaerovibrio lipolyticus DSM 3074]|uniref:Glycerate kinase n=2 Tax=Anaerovibrio lipolyticus TaxID=82374 RepID=A0A0B2JXP6_9FIRM|nr:glycerate kinase [Anaerovibrio lipolyticus]KHM51483.1 glycerate kinase [Anaerovibrio lipolyticus]SHJ05675.1 glycerate kinase [Anaerovibrio lipolyticus DSM 3074]